MGRIDVFVNTHGHCFDGAASAAMFTALAREIGGKQQTFAYRSCGYGPKMSRVPPEWLTGKTNAILDFRHTESDQLTYYFDHHKTAFGSLEEETTAKDRAASSGRKVHYDASYGSCTKLIADVALAEYGVDLSRYGELVRWADTIDSAGFASAALALADTPAQRIAGVIEQHGDTPFLDAFVPLLLERSLDEVAAHALIADREPPIRAARLDFEAKIRAHAKLRGDVVFADLSDEVLSAAGKFVTYALFPEAVYSVLLLRTKQLVKLAVGYNPWSGRERRHDISELMKKEGGGGHAVVGAAAFAHGDIDRARAAAERVFEALSR